jgi:CRISPR-associated exonuclease Cas4
LVQNEKGVIPVEVKSGAAPRQPYEAHILQLAAYCLLVEEQEGRRPPYGILKYDDRAFEVDFVPALRAELLDILGTLRQDLHARDVERSHNESGRCRGCGYREQCNERLA